MSGPVVLFLARHETPLLPESGHGRVVLAKKAVHVALTARCAEKSCAPAGGAPDHAFEISSLTSRSTTVPEKKSGFVSV